MDYPLGLLIVLVVLLLWKLDAIEAALKPPPAPRPVAPPEPARWVDTSPRHTLNVRAYRQAEAESLWHI